MEVVVWDLVIKSCFIELEIAINSKCLLLNSLPVAFPERWAFGHPELSQPYCQVQLDALEVSFTVVVLTEINKVQYLGFKSLFSG